MRSFLKMFFAALLAFIVFCGVIFIFFSLLVGGLMSKDVSRVEPRSVLFIDLAKSYGEKKVLNPFLEFTGNAENEIPTLYELVRLVQRAKSDSLIKGIYVKAEMNRNGYAASEELRNALTDFKSSGKFVVAYGDYISQQAYHVANVATRIYINPKGIFEWTGFAVEYVYFKNLLKRLEIEPQIFYDGKFKSATEPFREEKMTDANRLQTSVWLGDVYERFLMNAAASRKLDTANLRSYANQYLIRTPGDAVTYKLVDGVRYDDEVKDEIKKQLKIGKDESINFITPGSYLSSKSVKQYGKDKVAVVFAEGEIIDGKGEEGQIGSDTYKNLIRKLRYNDNVKAIVLRVNSPGGSSLASEVIWRELYLARKEGKPVVVSMGDVAASGGYYVSCMADSIFAQPNTITGSIGVFAMIPNMESFFRNKLGVTFDRVKTGDYADALTISKPLNPQERKIIQNQVDMIYADFKQRVADGRNMDTAYVDSIAQGRVWTGTRASKIGLVDRVGGIDDAIRSAAKLAKLKDYQISEYPEPKSPFDELFGSYMSNAQSKMLEKELGEENVQLLQQVRKIKDNFGKVQARLPFEWNWK
ncbi:MAG TPA: signal peptide peptidase SppA [Chitinophagaceae bacterium]|nr:signal peptide peptidase SppA [Chitinophagaceae bacterium]